MIKSIIFTNFFSFSSLSVNLSSLNALVGINGSGKTNFLKAIKLLRAVVLEEGVKKLFIEDWGGFESVYYLGETDKDYIQLEFEFDPKAINKYGTNMRDSIYYRIRFHQIGSSQNYYICEKVMTKDELGADGYIFSQFDNNKGWMSKKTDKNQTKLSKVRYNKDDVGESVLSQILDKDRYVQLYALREAIKDIVVYDYFDTTLKSKIRKPSASTTVAKLNADGTNLPQILNTIKIGNKIAYLKLAEALSAINPNFTGLDFNVLGGNIELMLEEAKLNKSIHTTHISDGTLRYLCLLAIIYNAKRGSLVCIDELEVGLHPDMISEIMQAIRETATETQYILPTHSENVLDSLQIDNIIVFEKENNQTIVNKFIDDNFVEWAKDFAPGRLWKNGDIGGNRY